MKSRILGWALLGTALALSAPASAQESKPIPPPGVEKRISPALGMPNFATLTSVEGLPPDAVARNAFVSGFRGAFAEEDFVTERAGLKPDQLKLSVPIANRFRLLEGDRNEGAWTVQLTFFSWGTARAPVGGPGARLKAPRPGAVPADTVNKVEVTCRVNIVTLSPEAIAAGVRPLPVREELVFHVPVEPRAAFFTEAGRAVAMVVLEALHHGSADLPEDERLRIPTASRKNLLGETPTTRGR
jgi:hypothetical protein